jgi:class 3 adenylate cyclase
LSLACLSCDHVNAPGSKFCVKCGAILTGPSEILPSPDLAPSLPQRALSAERCHLTVMFCDLVGSTELSVHLDVEDLQELIGAYQRRVAEIVTRFGGFVARRVGDGVLVYFGYPNAEEDDPE